MRTLRSKQVAVCADSEPNVKPCTKTTVSEKAVLKKSNKAKSNDKKTVRQDENSFPSVKNKVHSHGNGDLEITLKSPVLRDRTNNKQSDTTNKHSKVNATTEKPIERGTKMAKTKKSIKKPISKAQKKCNAKVNDGKELKSSTSNKIDSKSQKITLKKKSAISDATECDNKNNSKGDSKKMPISSPASTRSRKSMNISVETLERMLNSDENVAKKDTVKGSTDKELGTKSEIQQQPIKKFFKLGIDLHKNISSKSAVHKKTNKKGLLNKFIRY